MGREEVYTGAWWENLMERDYLEDTGIDRMIILKWIFKKWDVGIELAQDGDRWRVLVIVVMNLRVL
jgi:hypothetical protein